MKILMTADTVGGVWTYSVELAKALSPYDVQVVLATMGAAPTAEQRAQVAELENVELTSSDYKLEWQEDPWQDVEYAGQWLLRLEQQHKPDLVHLNGYVHGALPWNSPLLVAGHSCVLSWWRAVKGCEAPAEWNRYSHLVATGLHSAAMVIAPTKAMLKALETHYGCFPFSRVVYNGRDASAFPPGEKTPIVFTAGRVWDEAKNISILGKVAPRLDWPLYVAGDEQHPAGGGEQPENVQFLGRVAPQAVPFWYSRASIYALPAKYEPFGLSVLEAGLAGCALVLGDIPSLREVWEDAATFVPPEDTQALEAAIRSLILNDSRREQMAARARARALQYTPERMAKSYMEALETLMTSGRIGREARLAANGGKQVVEVSPCE